MVPTDQRIRVALAVGVVLAVIGGLVANRVAVQQPSLHSGLHFATQPPGTHLPADFQCASMVMADTKRENKPMNASFNGVTGQRVGAFFPTSDDARANLLLAPRIDGNFAGTTAEILRWAACKWGIDEDIVAAQAAVESWWHQNSFGDWDSDGTACPPEHGIGTDGVVGKCPQSYGILQNRYPYEISSWPGIATSTAMNVDTAYAIWRACYDGYELWLNDVERGAQYQAGDVWGCIGRWYAGRWQTKAAQMYASRVQADLNRRVWELRDFQDT